MNITADLVMTYGFVDDVVSWVEDHHAHDIVVKVFDYFTDCGSLFSLSSSHMYLMDDLQNFFS